MFCNIREKIFKKKLLILKKIKKTCQAIKIKKPKFLLNGCSADQN